MIETPPPCTLELINLTDQSQQLRCDLNGLCLHHTGLYAGLCRNVHPKNLGHVAFRNVPDAMWKWV
jgi:hypothetical protein